MNLLHTQVRIDILQHRKSNNVRLFGTPSGGKHGRTDVHRFRLDILILFNLFAHQVVLMFLFEYLKYFWTCLVFFFD